LTTKVHILGRGGSIPPPATKKKDDKMKIQLKKILDDHKKWLLNDGGQKANLSRANLSGANLFGADLSKADLSKANLFKTNLSRANLSKANLSGADLSGANLEFYQFPSIRLLSSISLSILSNKLTLELMQRDAYAHPNPDSFELWAKGGKCPYQNEERFWFFQENKELWKTGKPQMRDSDLIIAICKDKGWKIKGYLK